MEMGYETRPLSIHKVKDWQNGSNSTAIPSGSTFLAKRRSTTAHVPPPGPPPSQPIPNLPPSQYDPYDGMPISSDRGYNHVSNGSYSPTHPYTRPTASSNLAAVAAFSQARHATYTSNTASSSTENLSDSPPRSMLRSAPRSPGVTHEIIPDRLLLSPPEPRTSEPRPSSRRALTRALELAREAVQLDSTNDDPYGAVVAYGKSVALLSEVMERVMRGEDSTDHRRKNGRRRSVVAQEEEVRRLKSIHDTYADRMNILSLIYSIPLPTTSPPTYASSSWSTSSASTQPSSPTSSSPTSESSEHLPPRASSSLSASHTDGVRTSLETTRGDVDAIFTLDESLPSATSPRTPMAPSTHPYASAPPKPSAPSTNNRLSVATPPRPQVGRSRASSTLPPPAPLPTTSPPPAPASAAEAQATLKPLDAPGRSRGPSVSHRRAGSGSKLVALSEEGERTEFQSVDATGFEGGSTSRSRSLARDAKRESHPLPPLPSPTPESTPTPRHPGSIPESNPQSPASPTGQRRASSTRPDVSNKRDQAPLINSSTTMGTISQRRIKTSAPPSTMMGMPSSPTESTGSVGSAPGIGKLTASSLPVATASRLDMVGRSRAASQPGRRPSMVTASSYPGPPQTASIGSNGSMVLRKPSVPSRLNPHAPPQITINTALLSPPLSKGIVTPLVPPPPIPHGNIPTAPTSPLPPMAPLDPLRKPYHMMSLLRQTMISKTGGYITRRLHVPQEVWSQGGAKLTNIPEKIRVVEVLSSALEDIQSFSVEYFGAGSVSSGMAMGIGSIGKKEADMWALKLEEFSNICDGVVGNFGKKLGVGEGFATKKSSGVTSWGGRLTRQFDKLTNGKNLDSPALYVQGLAKLFNQAQILDEHAKAVSSQPLAPLYTAFPPDVRAGLELKLRRASEFFAKVVLTFVIRDMALLLDKYVKKCEKWLAE